MPHLRAGPFCTNRKIEEEGGRKRDRLPCQLLKVALISFFVGERLHGRLLNVALIVLVYLFRFLRRETTLSASDRF